MAVRALLTLALAVVISLPAPAATVSGTVRFTGTPSAPVTVPVAQDTEICGSEQQSADVVVGAGQGLRWAVVQISSAGGATASDELPTMDQSGCKFIPRVVVARPGEEMAILNSDGILHNVHTYSTKNAVMNKAQPGFIKKLPGVKFDQSEVIQVKCDVHAWMKGWIVVTDSPHATVTGEDGSFSLADVPAGTHTLSVWHETLGEQSKEINVTDGQDIQVVFEFTGE